MAFTASLPLEVELADLKLTKHTCTCKQAITTHSRGVWTHKNGCLKSTRQKHESSGTQATGVCHYRLMPETQLWKLECGKRAK